MTFSELENKFFRNYEVGAISDEQLVQHIDRAMIYLGAKTIATFSKQEGVDYNVIKKRKTRLENPLFTFTVGGVEFVKDNEWPPKDCSIICEIIEENELVFLPINDK